MLDADFMTVADVFQYCQGTCDNVYEWENADVFERTQFMKYYGGIS